MRASPDEHRAPGHAAVVAVAGLAATALLAAFLSLGIGNRIVDAPDAERHHATASVLDDLANAVLPAAVVLFALVVAGTVVLLASVPPERVPVAERRGRAPPRAIDV